MCWRSSPDRERPMVRLKRSTAGLNICAGLLWGSVTSPTTSPGVCSSPVASDRFYTLNYDEPLNGKVKNSHIWNGDEGPKLDLFSVWDDGVVAWTHMDKMKWRYIPRKWFLDHSPIEVDGIRMEASEHAPEFLEERYGPNWRTPDKYHDWRWPLNG